MNDLSQSLRSRSNTKRPLEEDLEWRFEITAIIEEASHHYDTRAPALCAHLRDGEIALFEKAYIHFQHLHALHRRRVWWVARAKDNMAYTVRKSFSKIPTKPTEPETESKNRIANQALNPPYSQHHHPPFKRQWDD